MKKISRFIQPHQSGNPFVPPPKPCLTRKPDTPYHLVGSIVKKFFILAFVCGCLLPSSGRAMDLKQAKFTQVVNNVEVISAADKSLHNASVSDTFQMPDVLRTGPSSRAELAAADGTITRVGANTIFSFDAENRTIDLQQGSLLFHSPHGKGGGTIRTGSATASVVGTTIIVTCTPDGGFKLLDLEGETEVRFLNGLKQHLEPGQMTFILPGGTQPSPIIIFRLDTQSKGSMLLNGFDHPLPSIARIDAEVTRQLLEILNNQVGDTGLLVGNNATANSVQVFQDLQTISSEIHQQISRNNNSGNNGESSVPGDNGNNSGGGGYVSVGGAIFYTEFPGDINISPNGIIVPITSGDVGVVGNGIVDINTSVIFANGDVNISSQANIDVENTEIDSDHSVSINAPDGSVTLNGSSVSGENAMTFSSGADMTINDSTISATGGIDDSGSISASSGGTLTITGQDGNTSFGYDIGADGSITLSGAIAVSISDALIKTLDGDSGNTVTVSSDGNVSLQTVELDSDGLINLSAGVDADISGSILNAVGGDADFSAGGNLDIESTTISAGDSIDILALNGSVTLNNDSISGVNNVDVVAGSGLTVGGTSINADPAVGTISLNNVSGVTTINNGSSMQAFYISVNSPDGILLDATGGTYSGNRLDLNSGNADGTDEIDVQNADLTAFATVNMAAHTINLTDVAFGGASMVNLHSFFGLLADNPNTGAGSVPGYVNFINGVTYGGTLITSANQSTYVNPSSGPGIYIAPLAAGITSQSANLSVHTIALINVAFNSGGIVNLGSFSGSIPINAGSIPGDINIRNVTYGGNPVTGPGVTLPIGIGGNPGIYIHSN